MSGEFAKAAAAAEDRRLEELDLQHLFELADAYGYVLHEEGEACNGTREG